MLKSIHHFQRWLCDRNRFHFSHLLVVCYTFNSIIFLWCGCFVQEAPQWPRFLRCFYLRPDRLDGSCVSKSTECAIVAWCSYISLSISYICHYFAHGLNWSCILGCWFSVIFSVTHSRIDLEISYLFHFLFKLWNFHSAVVVGAFYKIRIVSSVVASCTH